MPNCFNKSDNDIEPSDGVSVSSVNRNLRCSDRVFVNLRVRLSAPTERGNEFLGEGQTVEVSRNGASILMDRDLRVGQTVKIRRVGVQKEAEARVVGLNHNGHSNARVFGIAFTDNQNDLWDIVFPPAMEPGKAVLRSLLRCVACGRLEVSYLNEFESDLFLNHHNVPRLCGQCGGWTTWTRPYGTALAGSEAGSESSAQHSNPLAQNHRSHERLRIETVGCIRNPSLGNEVVLVSNLARGGLSFLSANEFPEGTCIEMAIPYTSKAPNIYSLARIVGARKQTESLTEYRAAYLT